MNDISRNDLGKHFIDKYGEVWLMVGYIDRPACVMEKVKSGERMIEVIGCPNLDEWAMRRLVAEK